MSKKSKELQRLYKIAEESKIGSSVTCPSCLTTFTKEHYQSKFCKSKSKTKCKDYYWNNVIESKRNNTTRISPANENYYYNVILPQKAKEYGFPDVKSMKEHVDETDEWSVTVSNCEWCKLRPEYCRCE